MKKITSKLLVLTLLSSSFFSIQAYASEKISNANVITRNVAVNSSIETLSATMTPITSDYCSISGYAKDSNGNPLAHRKIIRATNFGGVPAEHSFIRADKTADCVVTDTNGYYKINLARRSIYSNYIYLCTNDNYSIDQMAEYTSGRISNWPFKWILEAPDLYGSNIRTYISIS